MRVARLRDGTTAVPWATRMLGGYDSGVAHHLGCSLEARERPELRHEGDGSDPGDAPQRLECLDDCLHVCGRLFHCLIDRAVEALEPLCLVLHRKDVVEQR